MRTPTLSAADSEWSVRPPSRTPALQLAIDRLFDRINYERVSPNKYKLEDFELSRMRQLLGELNNPHEATPCVHIAGTKGKGSTASMVSAVMTAAGHRTGLFTSPHIHHFEERIRVDGEWAEPAALEASFHDVWSAVDRLDQTGQHATYFEITTALAWEVFRRLGCNIAVVEVGLGGRLDSTNLCRPVVTAITSISRDHTKLLGETHAEIAREKGGIFKPGVPALSAATGEAAEEIECVAAENGCELWQLDRDVTYHDAKLNVDASPNASESPLVCRSIRVSTPSGEHDVPVVLPGIHQNRNTALVVAICDRLPQPLRPTTEAVRKGLASVVCPLRIEVMSDRPWIILDAAHNGASMAALVAALTPVRAAKRWLIFGTSRDKQVDEILEQLVGFADHIVATAYTTNPRAIPISEIANRIEAQLDQHVERAATPVEAITRVLQQASQDDLIVATGSFFLAAEIREHLLSSRAAANASAEAAE